jgi:Zn-dependent protease
MFRRPRSIKLMSVAGIRIGVDGTWFVMLFVLIFLLSGSFKDALHSSDDVAYVATVVTVLLFFASLIVHELGHAFAARRAGITVQRIELFILVCLAVNLVVVGPDRLIHAIRLDGTVPITPVLLALSWLLPMNLLILIFNLVPAYPLDGGRIARAFIWRLTGDKLRGTRAAAHLGEGFAFLLGAFGLFITLDRNFAQSWLGNTTFAGIWLIILSFMIWQSARMALNGTAAASRVQGVRVADIMDHEPVVVRGTATVEQALDESFLRYQTEWLPVIDGDRRFIGIARRERAQETVDDGQPNSTVGSILEVDDLAKLQIREDRPLTDVLMLEALGRLGAIVAVNDLGALSGVVTIDQVRRVLQTVLETPAAR